ncbi:MAG: hypothetical protein ABJN04_08765 [Hyphomicrobiales bacterium]
MKTVLIATAAAAVVLSAGAALAESPLGNTQFHPTGFDNNVSSTFDGNRGVNATSHNQFSLNSFKSNITSNFDGGNRTSNSAAKEFAPWVGSK